LKEYSDEEIKSQIVDSFKNRKFKIGKQIILNKEDIIEISKVKGVQNVYSLLVEFINTLKSSKIRKLKKKDDPEKAKKSQIKLKKLRKEILDIKEAKYLNEAFITFNSTDIPKVLVSNRWSIMFKRYVTRDLFFTKAFEPSDVIWENFGNSDLVRLLKILFSYFVALLILLCKCFIFFVDLRC
jgi:hypothetical protein